MSNGGTVEELDAQVKVLDAAMHIHWDAAQDAERQAVAHPTDTGWQDKAGEHRAIAAEYVEEIRLLRAEIRLLPAPREPVD